MGTVDEDMMYLGLEKIPNCMWGWRWGQIACGIRDEGQIASKTKPFLWKTKWKLDPTQLTKSVKLNSDNFYRTNWLTSNLKETINSYHNGNRSTLCVTNSHMQIVKWYLQGSTIRDTTETHSFAYIQQNYQTLNFLCKQDK